MYAFQQLFYLFSFLLLLHLDFDVFTLNILLLYESLHLLIPIMSLLNSIINLGFLIGLLPSTSFGVVIKVFVVRYNFILNYYVVLELAGALHHLQLGACPLSFVGGLIFCFAYRLMRVARNLRFTDTVKD